MDPITSVEARRIAICRALAVGLVCGALCWAVGKPLGQATVDGLIVVAGGLVAWSFYHLLSGRTDALNLVALNTLPVWRDTRDPWLPTLVITVLAMVGVGVVLGLVNRPPGEPAMADPGWWDAEFDGPG